MLCCQCAAGALCSAQCTVCSVQSQCAVCSVQCAVCRTTAGMCGCVCCRPGHPDTPRHCCQASLHNALQQGWLVQDKQCPEILARDGSTVTLPPHRVHCPEKSSQMILLVGKNCFSRFTRDHGCLFVTVGCVPCGLQ